MYITFPMYYTGLAWIKIAKFNPVQLHNFVYNGL